MVKALWTTSLAQESFSSTSRLCIESVFAASKYELVNGGPDDASYLHCGWVWCCNHRRRLLRMQVGMNKHISVRWHLT